MTEVPDIPDDEPELTAMQAGELLPHVDWTQLPSLVAGAVSEHANPVDLMLSDLSSPQSRRSYESRLASVARLFPVPTDPRSVPWQSLRYAHVIAIKEALRRAGKSPATINATLSALRKVTKTCTLLQLMDRDDMLAIRDAGLVKSSRLPSGREVRAGELEAIVRACQDDTNAAAGARDTVAIGLLYICGLRRNEVSELRIEQVDRAGASLRVIGKGNKERQAYLDPGTLAALDRWLTFRQTDEGRLVLPVNKSGRVLYDQGGVSDQAIYNLVKKRQRQAKVAGCAPHDFRRSFGTELLRQGIDLATVQRLMGHADPRTTARYDMRDPEEDRRATAVLHFPYVEEGDEFL